MGLLALLCWEFLVLSAVQLTIRLIMAYSVKTTLYGAVLLSVLALPIAAVYDAVTNPPDSFAARLAAAPIPMVLMAAGAFVICRWALGFRRIRGQISAAIMIGILAPHLLSLAVLLAPFLVPAP